MSYGTPKKLVWVIVNRLLVLMLAGYSDAFVNKLPDLSCHPGYNPDFKFLIKEQQMLKTWPDAYTKFCNVTHRIECRVHCMAKVIGIIDRKFEDMQDHEFYFNSADYLGNLWKDLFRETAETKGIEYPKILAHRVADICREAMQDVKGKPCQYMGPLMDCLADHLFCDLNEEFSIDSPYRRRRKKSIF